MSRKLDLTCYLEDTMEIILPDKTKVDLPKPSQRILLKLTEFGEIQQGAKNKDEIIKAANSITAYILNTNVQGRVFSVGEVGDFPIAAQTAIVKAYRDFAIELTSNPN